MKLKSLILGSVAAVGLSSASFAADPLGVFTSLDVCDAHGISGLTISSDTNCLKITGSVSYEFNWGDFNEKWEVVHTGEPGGLQDPTERDAPGFFTSEAVDEVGDTWSYTVLLNAGEPRYTGTVTVPHNPSGVYPPGPPPPDAYHNIVRAAVADAIAAQSGGAVTADDVYAALSDPLRDSNLQLLEEGSPAVAAVDDPDANQDWNSKVETWLQFAATADSDFGPAVAVIKMKAISHRVVVNEQEGTTGDTQDFRIDQAYVQIGDLSATTFYAGRKGTIANLGDDEPFDWLGPFHARKVDTGVLWPKDQPRLGNHVIQVVSNLGNGVDVRLGLENLEDSNASRAGTLVGVVGYAGGGITAHVTGVVGGILDGDPDWYAIHAGATATFDAFRIRGAFAAQHDAAADTNYWNGLVTGSATFDIFTLAASVEADGRSGFASNETNFGASGSIGATVTDGIAINLGGRFYQNNNEDVTGYQVAAQLTAAVTETITVTGEVGVYGSTDNSGADIWSDWYGRGELAWAPGGGFTSSLAGQIQENGAYKVTFKAAKAFE